MANKQLFKSMVGKLVRKTDTLNHEFAPAYTFTNEGTLAQFAATGCLNSTFYAAAGDQLGTVINLCEKVEPRFIAQTAVYARERGYMKDMPALLTAVLSVKDRDLMARAFERVVDNGKMLRNFVQIMRSGAVGRKSLGTKPKRLVQNWFETRSDEAVFRASVGNDPSLADVIKMVHPKPDGKSREALFGHLIGRNVDREALPALVRHYEDYKAGKTNAVPDVPFQMLTSLDLGPNEWKQIVRHAPWQMTRMNLNTFSRHDVFKDKEMADLIAKRLANAEAIRKARVFPYQLMMAFRMAGENIPTVVRDALQDAMEIATQNVPKIDGKVYVFPDVSGSMTWASVTGYRKGATSAVRAIDVAALVAATIVRRNPTAEVIPFEQDVVRVNVNPRDSIMTNANRLSKVGGGGTNCSAPLAMLNKRKAQGDLVVFVSDNESWVDARGGRGTETIRQWNAFKKRNPKARMVCIDIQPYGTTQAYDRDDILNIGGFSDHVFEIVSEFAKGRLMTDHWAGQIKAIEL